MFSHDDSPSTFHLQCVVQGILQTDQTQQVIPNSHVLERVLQINDCCLGPCMPRVDLPLLETHRILVTMGGDAIFNAAHRRRSQLEKRMYLHSQSLNLLFYFGSPCW